MPETAVITATLTLRLTISEPIEASTERTRQFKLQEFSDLLIDIDGLVRTAAFLSAGEEAIRFEGNYYASDSSALDEANQVAENFSIGRLAYHSPPILDLVPTIAWATAGGITLLAPAAGKIVQLWVKVSDARIRHHRARTQKEVEQVRREIAGLLAEEVKRVSNRRAAERQQVETVSEDDMKQLRRILDQAARGLERIEKAELE